MTAVFNKQKRPECSDYEAKSTKKVHNMLKLVIVGETNVGKTSLVQRFSKNTFDIKTSSTVHAEYSACCWMYGEQPVKVQLWDTTGQDCMRAIVPNFFRFADAILIVYDVTDMKSFEKLEDWFETVNQHSEPRTRLYVIGTKCDLMEKRVVPNSRVEMYLQRRKMNVNILTRMMPFETSAASGQGVHESFRVIVGDLLTSNPQDSNIGVHRNGGRTRDGLKLEEPLPPPLPLWRRLCC